ncbi:type II secretion system F family protein [Thermoproteota archaeon]
MKVPYCFLPISIIRRIAGSFHWLSNSIIKFNPEIKFNIKRAEMGIDTNTYLAAAIVSDIMVFIFLSVFTSLIFLKYQLEHSIPAAVIVSVFIVLFIFLQQMGYPTKLVNNKIKSIERNLLSALSTMQIQLSSGIPLFNIISSISKEDYGGVSEQFGRAVKHISAGMNQVDALEKLASENPSMYFQRIIWQIATAIRSGAELSQIFSEIIRSLSEEQLVGVQDYGSRLNPLTMFYMLVVVIVPALSITFFVVISSFIGLADSSLKGLMWGMYGVVMLFQFFFITLITSRRPNLL